MGMEVEGVERLQFLLTQIGDKATQGVLGQMKKEAIAMRDLARKFAPIDHGNLEEAIKVQTLGGGRDEMGRFARKSFSVFVDLDMKGHDGREIRRYAYLMHEHLTPFGPYNLGPNSVAKQEGQNEMVGGMYLERAASQISEGLMNRLIQVAQDFL
jgi:hypothetical protein